MAFNQATSGAIWPNTFAAKQAEYAPLLAQPYVARLAEQIFAVWVGPQLLLIPGVAVALWRMRKQRPIDWAGIVPVIWVLIHFALYAARLPVTTGLREL